MANVKKTVNEIIDKEVEIKEVKAETPKKVAKEETDSELLKMLKEQAEIIEKQKKALESLLNEKSVKQDTANANSNNAIMIDLLNTLKTNSRRDVVKVIHLDNVAQAIFKLSNGNKIRFTYYGQVQPMSIVDAELLLNQYKRTFERGALTFDNEHLYMIEECGIDTTKINYKPMEDIKNINSMSDEEIKTMLVGFKPFQREMLKSYILNELAKDKNFIEMDKLRYLNKISKNIYKSTHGGYEFIIDKLTKLGVDD